MKRTLIIPSAILLMAVAAVLYFRNSDPSPAAAEHEEAARAMPSSSAPSAVTSPEAVSDQSDPPVSEPQALSAELKRAEDYFAFANSLLEPAKSGDADAQYYLFVALDYCDASYRAFFRRNNGRTRTLDEALSRVSTRPQENVEAVRTAHERCSRMFEGGSQAFGTPADWLKLATKNEQPLALMETAKQMLTHPTEGAPTDATLTTPEQMLAKALRNKDPEVVWRIGEIQQLLDGDDREQMLRQWSWWLAACERGYDCEHSPWMEYSCRFDPMCAQDRNAVDFIRRATDLDFLEIESRAKEINTNIDAGSWGALGFGRTN